MARRSTRDLTEGNLHRNFALFTMPLILSSVLSQTFDLVDMVIAGRFLGDVALGATSAVNPVFAIFNSTFSGFTLGVGVYLAQVFGSGNYQKLKQVLYSVALVFMGVVALSSGALLALRVPVFRYLKVAAELYDGAMTYFVINMSCKVVTSLSWLGLYAMQGMGNTSFPFILSIVSAVLNLVGNIVTVAVFHWGIAGLAISSVASATIASVLYIFKVRQCFAELGVTQVKFRFSFHHVTTTFRFSLPNMIQQTVLSAAVFFQAPLINGLGKAATVSYALCTRLINLICSIYISGSRTVTNYIAQCIGGGKVDRVRRGMRLGLMHGLVYFTVPFLLCFFAAKYIFLLFFPAGYSGEALEIALRFSRFFMWTLIFAMFDNLLHGFFRGIGSKSLLILSTAIQTLTRIAAAYLLTPRLQMDGIFLSWGIGWFIEMMFVLTVYFLRYRNEALIRRNCLLPTEK